jgi:GntR family transcriptional regulator/MocR family aminotransferase
VTQHLPGHALVESIASGLHVAVWLTDIPIRAEPRLVAQASERGVGVWPITPLHAKGLLLRAHRCAGLVLGYAALWREGSKRG